MARRLGQLMPLVAEDGDVRLLAYTVSVERTSAVEFGRGGRRTHDIGSSIELLERSDVLLEELRSPSALTHPSPTQLHRFAHDWGRSLLPRDWLEKPPDVALIVPHGFLHHLPFHLIHVDQGAPLGAVSAMSACSSLTMLLRSVGRSANPGESAKADPFIAQEFPNAPPYFVAAVDALGDADDAWRRLSVRLLRHAGFEDADEDTAERFSFRSTIARRLAGWRYEIVILIAHAVADSLDPKASGMLVRSDLPNFGTRPLRVFGDNANESGIPYHVQDLPITDVPSHLRPSIETEMLSLGELELIGHLECPLVAMLGCSTGTGRIFAGDQPLSMGETMLRLGASAVVAPMWDVTVASVESWMTTFLAAWRQERRPRAEAAREAMARLHAEDAPLQDTGCLRLSGAWT